MFKIENNYSKTMGQKDKHTQPIVITLISNFIFFFFFLLLLFNLLTFVSAESCYVQFNLEESLIQLDTENFTTSFSYIDLENLYGNYEGFTRDNSVFQDFFYALKVYDSSNREIGTYSFDTSLLVFYDNFGDEENPGGIEVLNESVNSVVIPYGSDIYSGKVFMNDTLLLEFFPTGIICNRTCKIPGENGTTGERCCDNYLESWFNDDEFTCISCGDGVCSKYEDKYVCFKDCRPSVDEMNCSNGYIPSYYGCVEGDICGNNVIESGEECDDGDIFDDDGCSHDCKLEECKDHDFSNINWENSLLNSSYVFFDFNRSYDSCKNETTLIENYCGINLLRWDFWNINEKVVKGREVVCNMGCFDGACLENPEIPPQNNTTDLPEEPEAPSSIES